MTYFGFLALFLLPPMLTLLGISIHDEKKGLRLPQFLSAWPIRRVIFAHVLVAFLYTTPWDNYLVATGVWWYDPDLVTGITLGWVPVEEYTFFILQTITVGLWFSFLARRVSHQPPNASSKAHRKINRPQLRRWMTLVLTPFWLAAIYILATGWQPGNYLSLILVWALPPIMLQTLFGGDILWHHRRLFASVILTSTIYLGLVDSIAIYAGTWTINPEKTLGIYIGRSLPLEEVVFFLATNTLIGFGMTLVLAEASQKRVPPTFLKRIAIITGLQGFHGRR